MAEWVCPQHKDGELFDGHTSCLADLANRQILIQDVWVGPKILLF
jgi:hypothetical protein